MVGSALLGAIALGGALAFAYKQSGGAMGGGQTPVVQADSRPVKEAPQQAGGKEFPHKNKLIYERLQNGDQPEAERIVPRQEELAVPAMPRAAPGAAPMQPPAVATVDDPDGGPRRVKTMVVRPDGTMAEAAVPAPAPQQVAAAAAAAPPPAAPQQVAFAEPPMPAPPMPQAAPAPAAPAPAPVAEAAPPPAPAPAPVAADPQPVAAIPQPQVAAAEAAPAPAKPTKYVVQVGSKQNQTEALATFADMQQKYPTLLASYRPMVQKADLGTKGVWYRLRIGPIVDKTAASKLCGQLKSQGHPDCLVMAAQ
ncbi:MAG TPA: SPOR domain-containing protein, partial [Methyloceanibacter sp.]|nr:SPOR domain-containing protein [Methyloceanibacter sp.]